MKFLTQGEVGEALQAIYDNELNIRIESDWDGGYIYYIGDRYNGYGDSFHPASTRIEDVVSEICFRIAQTEPESDFAKYWTEKVNSIMTGNRPFISEAIEQARNLPSGYAADFKPYYVYTQEELDAMLAKGGQQQHEPIDRPSMSEVNRFAETLERDRERREEHSSK
jgi:hypothetical protein